VGTGHYILVQRDITEFKNLEKETLRQSETGGFGPVIGGHCS